MQKKLICYVFWLFPVGTGLAMWWSNAIFVISKNGRVVIEHSPSLFAKGMFTILHFAAQKKGVTRERHVFAHLSSVEQKRLMEALSYYSNLLS